jgi:hypothetical protein
MVTTHSIPTRAPVQDPISRDFTQKADRDPAVRRLTVCNSLRDVQGPKGRPTRAPQLLLRGVWLQRAGFYAGLPVKVHVSSGRLVIEAAEPERVPQTEALAKIATLVCEDGLAKHDFHEVMRFLKRRHRRSG